MLFNRTCCFLLSTLLVLPAFGDTVTSSVLVGTDGKPLTYTTPPKNMLTGITNPGGYTQSTHSATYTVGTDGKSLMYRGKDTGMKTQEVNAAGSKIRVVDENIPAKPRAPKPAPTGGGSGGGTGGTSGGSGSGSGASGGGSGSGSGGTGTGGTGGTGAGGSGGSGSGGSGAGTGAGAGSTGAGAGATAKPTVKGHIKGMSTGAKVVGVLGAVGGGVMVAESASGQQQHSGWDVAHGVGGGVWAGASIGSFFPGPGTAIGAAVGAVVGGAIAGSQLISETDCLTDPVTGKFTCCHTAFNKGERYADIGDYMFCVVDATAGVPAQYGTRQCQQGGSATAHSWWDGLWQDDAWTPECEYRYCNNDAPKRGYDNYIVHTADTENFCWKWQCANGLVRVGDHCERAKAGAVGVASNGNGGNTKTEPVVSDTSNERYELAIAKIQAQRNRVISMCGANVAATSTDNSKKNNKK